MSVQWFVLRGEQSEGPYTSSDLKLLADQRQITPDTLVKQGVSGPWVPAGTIEGLFVEYHGAKPAPTTGSPPPVRYVKPREPKAAVLATPPTLAQPHPAAESVEKAPSEDLSAERISQTARTSIHEPTTPHEPTIPTAPSAAAEDMQSPIWYLRTPDGQQYGPVSKSQLDQWAAEGRVGQDCWLWRAGWADWQGAGAVYSRLGQPLASAPIAQPGPASPGPQSSPGPMSAEGGIVGRTHAEAAAVGKRQPDTEAVGKGGGAAGASAGAAIPQASRGLEDPQRWIGQTLGHYQLIEFIGRGPSGVVYKARHTALDRWAAVRLIPIGGDNRLFEQLSQGLRAAVRLSHPHLVEVQDMGDTGGVVYLAMELMEGGSLADWIRRAGRLPPPAALAIFHQAASALAAVHMAGLLHRDIKPSNILFTGQGSAKLSDLGLAALAEARLRAGPAAVGSSVYYTAPEIFRGQAASVRSDLYSLGATFYHALTGRPPGEGSAVEEFFRRGGDIPIQPIGAILPGLPPVIGAMIDRLLLKDPGLRFSSVGELVEMFERMGGTLGGPGGRIAAPATGAAATAAASAPQPLSAPMGPPIPASPGTEPAGWRAKAISTWRNASWKVRLGVGLAGVVVLVVLVSLLWMLAIGRRTSDTPTEEPPSAQAQAEAQVPSTLKQPK